MKIIFGRSWITVVLLVISVSALAQRKDEEKYYQAESKTIRGEIWGWKNPEFAVRTIPAEFANASKVIIARHVEINADCEADDKRGFWVNSIYRDYYLTEITREVVKLNDKAAVADYSEFTFTKMARNYGMFYSTESVYIGVRVIKPDGTVKEIGAEEIVLSNNGSIKKEAKLAISDLQQGDIIDYFIAKKQAIGVSMGDVTNYSFPL
jgi:hypothetical protein